jgi:hypothetical protein
MTLKYVVTEQLAKVDLGDYTIKCHLDTIEYFATLYKNDNVIYRKTGSKLAEVLSHTLNHMIKLYFDDNK